jgi:secretion/DNA translocation related TadE-like protein
VARDRGSMTVWVAAVIALIGLVLTVAVGYGAAVTGRHRAETAADLAALAAAVRVPDGAAVACRTATRIVTRNGAVLRGCRVAGEDVEVEVGRPVRLGRFGVHTAVARARAGPV